jgi:hypothetical protein
VPIHDWTRVDAGIFHAFHHGWIEEISRSQCGHLAVLGQEYAAPADKPLTLAAYDAGLTLRAYVEPVAVGDPLPDMPLFREPTAHVFVPFGATYQRAFAVLPRRWSALLDKAKER